MAEKKLTPKESAFVALYTSNGFNGTKAAVDAGYSVRSARQIASENLSKPHIKAEIERRLAALTMGRNELLYRLTEQATFDVGKYLDIDDKGRLTVDLELMKADGVTHLIKKIWQGKDGIRLELYSAHAAKELIGKYHGLFVDRTFSTEVDEDFDLEEWRKKRAERLKSVQQLKPKGEAE